MTDTAMSRRLAAAQYSCPAVRSAATSACPGPICARKTASCATKSASPASAQKASRFRTAGEMRRGRHVSSYGCGHAIVRARPQADSPWPWGCSTSRIRQRRERSRVGIGLVLAALRVDGVRPLRAIGRDRVQRTGQGVDVGHRGAESQAHPRRSGQAFVMPGAHFGQQPVDLVIGDVQEANHERVGAEAAMPDPDPVLG